MHCSVKCWISRHPVEAEFYLGRVVQSIFLYVCSVETKAAVRCIIVALLLDLIFINFVFNLGRSFIVLPWCPSWYTRSQALPWSWGCLNTSPCCNALTQPSMCSVPWSTCTLHETLCTKWEFLQLSQKCEANPDSSRRTGNNNNNNNNNKTLLI